MKRKPKNPIHKIRTGTGDAGTTFLRSPGVSKSDPLVQFAGDLDEASAALGFVEIDRSTISCDTIDMQLTMKQMLDATRSVLFQIGAMIHSETAREERQSELDQYVDAIAAGLAFVINMAGEASLLVPLEGFIVPNKSNAAEMMARSIVRRAERSAVSSDCIWAVPALNSMSDFLFLIAWHNTTPMEQWTGF